MTTAIERITAEQERSKHEAQAHTNNLRIGNRTFDRYFAPSLETAYPLEYVFAQTYRTFGEYALDLGCGTGLNSVLLAAQPWTVLGVDVSRELIMIAERRGAMYPRFLTSFSCEDAHFLPCKTRSQDLVMGVAILHHLDMERVIPEIARVLKPRTGIAVFQEPIRDNAIARWFRKLFPRTGDDISPFETPFKSSDLLSWFTPEHGFEVLATRVFRSPVVKLLKPCGLEQLAYRLDQWILNVPGMERFATVRVIVARRV